MSRRPVLAGYALLAALTLFRLVYGARTGLANDECYYWQWSRRLALSYYDQGPAIAYLLRLGTLVFGDTALGVRVAPTLLASATGGLAFAIARRWFGTKEGLWTLGLTAVAPLLAAGGVLATYDGPQVFFWTLGMYLLTRLLQERRPALWYALGLVTALGILSKLTMLLFLPSVLLLLALTPAYRGHLRTPHPYAAAAIALCGLAPILLWNAQHGWMGLLHTHTLGSRVRGTLVQRVLGDFFGGQALVVGPLLWLAELAAIARLWRRRERPESRFLLAFFVPTLVICVWTACRSKMEANWPAPMHVAGLLAAGAWFAEAWRAPRNRIGIAATVALSSLLTALAFFPEFPGRLGFAIPAKTGQKLCETYGWPEIAQVVQAGRERLAAEGRPVEVGGINYRVNSVLAFYLPGQPQTQSLFFGSRRDQYFLWTRPETLVGHSFVLCLDNPTMHDPVDVAQRYFASVEAYALVRVTRPGFRGPVKQWQIYLCRNFKGYDKYAHLHGY